MILTSLKIFWISLCCLGILQNMLHQFPISTRQKNIISDPIIFVKHKSETFPLYRNTSNPLKIFVEGLCDKHYNFSYSISNGTIVEGGKQGEITIFPKKADETVLTVYNQGKIIDTKKFKVLPIPPPKIFLANTNGDTINVSQPIKPPSVLFLVAKADELFAKTLPTAANYGVSAIKVIQYRGGKAIMQQNFGSGAINLTSFNIRSGDNFEIQLLSIFRLEGCHVYIKPHQSTFKFSIQ
jgi:hypothetical protein